MFIRKEIFDWPFSIENGSALNIDYLSRAYDIWRHAKNKIKGQPSEFERAECILALKKSIDNRLKSLRSAYSLDFLPSIHSKKKQLEKLEEYGLVRPAILKELFDLRNEIEHNDEEPPSTEKCHIYVDLTWYFLKCTDALLDIMTESLIYEEGTSTLHIFYSIKNEWSIRIQGNIEEQYLSTKKKDGYLEIKGTITKNVKDCPMLIEFEGALVMDDNLLCLFARDYFSASGYYYEDQV